MKEQIKEKLHEALDKSKIIKISVFDFDGTLVDSPLPEYGKPIYKEKTGKDWPHKGWWSKKESLDLNIFDIPVVPETISDYKIESMNPYTLTIMMTGRMQRLSNEVETILRAKNLDFDAYYYNKGGNTLDVKIRDLENLLDEYPNVKTINLWEDRLPHVKSFQEWGDSLEGVQLKINVVKSDHHDNK